MSSRSSARVWGSNVTARNVRGPARATHSETNCADQGCEDQELDFGMLTSPHRLRRANRNLELSQSHAKTTYFLEFLNWIRPLSASQTTISKTCLTFARFELRSSRAFGVLDFNLAKEPVPPTQTLTLELTLGPRIRPARSHAHTRLPFLIFLLRLTNSKKRQSK